MRYPSSCKCPAMRTEQRKTVSALQRYIGYARTRRNPNSSGPDQAVQMRPSAKAIPRSQHRVMTGLRDCEAIHSTFKISRPRCHDSMHLVIVVGLWDLHEYTIATSICFLRKPILVMTVQTRSTFNATRSSSSGHSSGSTSPTTSH